MDKDPLSLLAGDSSSSESDGENGSTGKGRKSLRDESYYTSSETANHDRLPSPTTLFSTIKEPEFLKTHLPTHRVNWDNLIKDIPEDTPLSEGRGFTAIPPPLSHDEDVDPRAEISSNPVKYTVSELKAVDPKLLTVNSGVAIGNKRESGDDDKVGGADHPAAKKSKGESFKEKEKRKRDLGMTSRGKSFVEEEKRILREQFN